MGGAEGGVGGGLGASVSLINSGSWFPRIPRQRQKLRSGFPPRELLPPVDPTQPVELHNGEKVSVDILPLAPAETEVRGLEDRGEVSPDSKSTEIQQRTQQGN